ncbi:serine hydrolase domain-containing protein [Skermania piniformis]|uniref:Beta-lactamase family protein n=1 Tax=Skermania pinensis TaxID=39122 RepID=A0ABX8SEY7_9ACTN|nr:serine hydrolase domain-containing protein [Skermania piniformis]QXQ14985.1 beta-lactamase family protein [Skermania piniformis]
MHSLLQVQHWPVPAAAAAVVHSDGRVAGSVGDPNRVFELASVTKLLVSHGVLVAVEEGAIELDQPAGPAGATVRHLLSHASGVGFDDREVHASPGTRRIYSSAGYEILAETVTAATGIPFPDYLAEAVFEPLGMRATVLAGSAGYAARSTMADLIAFAAELQAPRLIAPQTSAAAHAVQFPGLVGLLPGYGIRRPNDWGLGPEIRGDKQPHWTGTRNSPATFGHFGQSGTLLWADPRAGVACVGLTDRPFGDWAKPRWTALADAVLAELAGDSAGR